jgi:hypothetical protein
MLCLRDATRISMVTRFLALLFFLVFIIPCRAQLFTTGERCGSVRAKNTNEFGRALDLVQSKPVANSSKVFRIPVVVHILHTGEPIGEGYNFSAERIVSQVRVLNEDFRRKEGTPGFNSHPDGADTRIEFVLAQIDPDGRTTDGIVRVDRNKMQAPPGTSDLLAFAAAYSYWDPERYVNIWCFDIGLHGLYAGKSHFPVSDLDGLAGQVDDGNADGIFINAVNFGTGDSNTLENFDMGRTLTHEMGHYFGLFHTFGPPGNCDYSDYCDDTPAISAASSGCPATPPVSCDGRAAMIENYMDYSYDRCMSVFTKDQGLRMRYVLENSARRKSLVTSPVIDRSSEVITGIPDDGADRISIFPNPVSDNIIHVNIGDGLRGQEFTLTGLTVSGKIVFKESFTASVQRIEVPILSLSEKIIILSVEVGGRCYRQKIIIK